MLYIKLLENYKMLQLYSTHYVKKVNQKIFN